MAKKQQFPEECCNDCGHPGYKELLVCCKVCSQIAVHKYCLGVVPGSIEDKEASNWICYYCCEPLDSGTSDRLSDNVSTLNVVYRPEDKTEMILIEEEPEPLCILLPGPEGYRKISKEEEPPEIMRGVILLVSPSGEIIIHDDSTSLSWPISVDMACAAQKIMTDHKLVKKVLNSCNVKLDKTKTAKRKRELEQLDMVGYRRSPRFKRCKFLKKRKGFAVC